MSTELNYIGRIVLINSFDAITDEYRDELQGNNSSDTITDEYRVDQNKNDKQLQ